MRFRENGDTLSACRAALSLSIGHLVNLGNDAAARGWLARAEGLTRGMDPNPMQGWLWELQGFLSEDPARSQELFGRALQFSRAGGDIDLELVALSDLGLALVAAGRAEEGLSMLDEAMAATLGGEWRRLDTVVFASCNMLSACGLQGDLDRASKWCRAADDFMRTHSSPFLFAHCRAHYGSVLVAKGHWPRAEAELAAALKMSEEAGPDARAEATGRLAELRLRQGRLEEAEALLAGREGAAALPAAAIRLARGQSRAAPPWPC